VAEALAARARPAALPAGLVLPAGATAAAAAATAAPAATVMTSRDPRRRDPRLAGAGAGGATSVAGASKDDPAAKARPAAPRMKPYRFRAATEVPVRELAKVRVHVTPLFLFAFLFLLFFVFLVVVGIALGWRLGQNPPVCVRACVRWLCRDRRALWLG
jgi:hypothetical protein